MKKSLFGRGIASLAVCTFMLPIVGSAGAHGSKVFPSYIPFDLSQGEIPEGVAVDKTGNVYVSIGVFGPRGEIWKFSPSGERSLLIDFGTPGVVGLAVDAIGNVYVARTAAPPDNGVFRVDRNGVASRLPGTEQILFPDALAFDQEGNLFVTEMVSFDPPLTDYPGFPVPFGRGGIWRIPRNGNAELLCRDDLLTGLGRFPGLVESPVGANGIAFSHGALYVNNTERGIVLRIPVLPNGELGTIEIVVHVPDPDPSWLPFFGPPVVDGIALDVHGNIYLAVTNRHSVMRVNADGSGWEILATVLDGLDAPTSLVFGTGKGERKSLFVINLSLVPGFAGPSLMKIDAGIPGMPLP